MSFADELQIKLENASLYFQGGVRRNILIIAGVAVVLLAPSYFGGQLISRLYRQVWYDKDNQVNSKVITVNTYDISDTQIVQLSNGTRDLYVAVSNKRNQEIGYSPWNYTVQLLSGNDQIIKQERITSYLLPDDTKYIVVNTDDPTATKIRITEENGTTPVLYNPLSPLTAKIPNIEIRQQTLQVNPDNSVQIIAQFKNNDIVRVEKINVLYIVRDTRQAVVGIGTLEFSGFLPGTLRDFSLNYPTPSGREPKFIDLRWSVNYLDPNIVKRI